MHPYFAEASALEGFLKLPLDHAIPPQAFVHLCKEGGYLAQRSGPFRVGEAISFRSAYTQVSGKPEVKEGRGNNTLVTAVVEGFNALDVVTADRIVAQISTEHPREGHGYIPSINFLGTRFENLCIAGHKIDVELDLDLLGKKPAKDAPYSTDTAFQSKTSEQHAAIRSAGLPPVEVLPSYTQYSLGSGDYSQEKQVTVECSLVKQAKGYPPGQICGHVIEVPHFGVIHLAHLRLKETCFRNKHNDTYVRTHLELTMLDLQMGCTATGKVQIPAVKTNGGGKG